MLFSNVNFFLTLIYTLSAFIFLFMGFEIFKQSDWYGDNVPAIWTISKFDPMLRGVIKEQITATSFQNSPNSFINKVNYFYDYTLIANPTSPIAPVYNQNISRNESISGMHEDIAEQSIDLLSGFHINGENGSYFARILPPIELSLIHI